ncbi:histidine phosphatase family protein [Streptomyces sp. CC224E]|uniref:histidine phosphatase family protein n=1 Tax=unclassified Streptomyces TaxID=2593676 RepID=UPI0035592857
MTTLRRTRLSAAPLAQARGLQALVRDGIREVSAGRWEGASDHASHTAVLKGGGSSVGTSPVTVPTHSARPASSHQRCASVHLVCRSRKSTADRSPRPRSW